MAYIIKAKIMGLTKPPVWRLCCGSDATFSDLNSWLESAFGWSPFHLHEFTSSKTGRGGVHIGNPENNDWEPVDDERKVTVSQVFRMMPRFYWTYDFGDNWVIELTREGCEYLEDETQIRIRDYKGMAPEEDCGGVAAWQFIKKVIAEEPDSEEARRYLEWMGYEKAEDFDPDNAFAGF